MHGCGTEGAHNKPRDKCNLSISRGYFTCESRLKLKSLQTERMKKRTPNIVTERISILLSEWNSLKKY